MPDTEVAIADPELAQEETVAAAAVEAAPEVAPETQAAAAEEQAPEEKPFTRAEFEELLKKERSEADAQGREQERRRIQSENGRRASQEAAQRAEQEETYGRFLQRQKLLTDKLRVAAYNMGVPNAETQEMGQVLAEAVGEAEPLIRDATLQQAGRAVSAIANEVLGLEPQAPLTAQEHALAARFRVSLEAYLRSPAVRGQIVAEERQQWEADFEDKLQKAVQAARREERQGQPAVRQVDGRAGPTLKQDKDSIIRRIAYGADADGNAYTDADKLWYEANIMKKKR